MDKKDLRIVYMGTPDFAVESLKKLVDGGYNIVAVVTMPDKPAGRGHKIQFSPVKEFALSRNLPLLQPEKLKDESFLRQLADCKADLQIVVAFRMLPEVVWNMPRLGTFNLHASLLPKYRGAAPINWAIINGEKQTGVTTFFLKQEIDTGNIIMQESIDIDDNENAGSVHDRLMYLGADLVKRTVDRILDGNVSATPQPALTGEPAGAPKIFKETCRIDFTRTARQVHNFIRGLSPYPAAWCELEIDGKKQTVKIYTARPETCSRNEQPGQTVTDGKTYLKVAVADGYVDILELQLPGKKRMTAKDMLNGLRHTSIQTTEKQQ